MSILLTRCWMIYRYYRKKLHLNHFLYAVINHERISNSRTCTTLFCRAVKWKLKCLKQRRKAGDWELLKIWNRKFIFYYIFRKEMPYSYLILQVFNFVFSPSFFFGGGGQNHRAEYSKKPKTILNYFCHSIKSCNCCSGISLLWSTVEKSWTTKISRKEQSVMIEKTEDTTTSWHWELMR